MSIHIPVLKKEVIKYLDPEPNQNFIDCTFGEGGHTRIILKNISPEGKVLGIEWDFKLYQKLKKETAEFSERLILANDSFGNLKEIVRKKEFNQVQGILFDLGMSSWHLEESKKGFSFRKNEPLDMRYNPKNSLTAERIINKWGEKEIRDILKDYGEERFAKRIARQIVKTREKKPIKTTLQLVETIKRTLHPRFRYKRTHFATRTFQALRITVNKELENIKEGLRQSIDVLDPEGRIVVISFHSLEDRIVKRFFKEKSQENILKILTKKPITPLQKEVNKNPRSRSAKLRAAEKINN